MTGQQHGYEQQIQLILSQSNEEMTEQDPIIWWGSLSMLDQSEWQNSAGWLLDVANPDSVILNRLVQVFAIHPVTRQRLYNNHRFCDRVAFFPHYYIISTTALDGCQIQDIDTRTAQVHLMVFAKGVLCVHFSTRTFTEAWRRHMYRLSSMMFHDPHRTCCNLVTHTMNDYKVAVRALETELRSMRDCNLIAQNNSLSSNTMSCIAVRHKHAQELLRLLRRKIPILQAVTKSRSNQSSTIDDDNRAQWTTMCDQTITSFSKIGHIERALSRLRSLCLAQTQVGILAENNHTLVLFTRLTFVVSSMISIYGIIGLFSMNVAVPGRHDNSYYPFIGIVFGVMTTGCGIVFRARQLLSSFLYDDERLTSRMSSLPPS